MSHVKKRVMIGLSGGVDSAVSALLLKEQGYELEAIFMKNWEENPLADPGPCMSAADLKDAEAICQQLDIPLHVVNFSRAYWDRVFSKCLTEFQKGRTPNPDILCNQEIKFKIFFEYALNLGADYIATGHYAQKASNGDWQLKKACDLNKDQSYFLYTLSQTVLEKTLFPIGHLNKTVVRKIASDAGFCNHQKKDSTGICFIGERKFQGFLSQYLPLQPGIIETPEGKPLGEHLGLMFYTIGQRQGLKIGGVAKALNAPWYVIKKDIARNVLIVSQGEDHPLLYESELMADQLQWIGEPPALPFQGFSKIRYRQADQACQLEFIQNNPTICRVKFERPQRAITAGQAIVFYHNDICLGGGTIQ